MKAIFYHAGCPVCLDAEAFVTQHLGRSQLQLEIVHLGHDKSRVTEAATAGVRSVPALVIGGRVLHLNHGASLGALS